MNLYSLRLQGSKRNPSFRPGRGKIIQNPGPQTFSFAIACIFLRIDLVSRPDFCHTDLGQ